VAEPFLLAAGGVEVTGHDGVVDADEAGRVDVAEARHGAGGPRLDGGVDEQLGAGEEGKPGSSTRFGGEEAEVGLVAAAVLEAGDEPSSAIASTVCASILDETKTGMS
jgi:hypothetical protein